MAAAHETETPSSTPESRTAEPRPAGPAATPKQREFLRGLIAELDGADGPAATLREAAVAILDLETLDRRTASYTIGRLMDARREYRKRQYKATVDGLEEEGMYRLGVRIYRVKRSEAGRLYAMELVVERGLPRFMYDRGAIFNLRPEHRMSVEEAAEHSRKIGACCVCGTTLTDPKSIARGIGPVCASRV